MKVVKMRCPSCGSTPTFHDQTLEMCRNKVCPRCNIRLIVTSSEGQINPPPMPPGERVFMTTKEVKQARRILVEAFGPGKE